MAIQEETMRLDVRRTIDESPMSRFQVIAVTVCVVLNMLDGFDVLAMAFTAASVSAEWHLNGKQVGVLLSAGLFGMGAGSLFLAPLADRFGRRAIILTSLLVIAAGMLMSAFASNAEQLALLRALTGAGIGGMLASLTVITAEYSSNRWRSGAISMQSTGYALGATLGGIVAAVLLASVGWRSVFLFGGIATAATLPLVLAWLPESIDHIMVKRPRGALEKVNRILGRMGRAAIETLPELPPQHAAGKSRALTSLLSPAILPRTLAIWLAFFLVMASFYFVMSWTPKLLVQAGMSASQGITGGVLLNVGGMFGCTLFSLLSARMPLRSLLYAYLMSGVATLVMFGFVMSSLEVSMMVAVAIGAAVSGCIGGLYALAPLLYPTEARATGMGWAIGMGRIGAILAPLSVGALVDAGWQVSYLYVLFAAPLVIAAVAVTITLAGLNKRGDAQGESGRATVV